MTLRYPRDALARHGPPGRAKSGPKYGDERSPRSYRPLMVGTAAARPKDLNDARRGSESISGARARSTYFLCKGRRLGQARKREKAGSDGAMHVGLLNASGSPNESDGTHNAKHDAAGVACRYRYFPVAREKDWRPGGTRSPTKFAGPGPAREELKHA